MLKVAAVVAVTGSFTDEQLLSMLKAGGLELPPGTSIRLILRSLKDADMLDFDLATSRASPPTRSSTPRSRTWPRRSSR